LHGVADLRYESSLVGFLKPRSKLTFGYDAQLAFIPWFCNAQFQSMCMVCSPKIDRWSGRSYTNSPKSDYRSL